MLKRRIDPRSRSAFVAVKGSVVRAESVLSAAHVLSGKAEVWVGEDEVELRPKGGGSGKDALEALAAEFAEEVVTQELRRRVAAANRTVRDYLVTQALITASGDAESAAQQPMGSLSEGQEKDIEQLIAEAEQELAQGQAASPAAQGSAAPPQAGAAGKKRDA